MKAPIKVYLNNTLINGRIDGLDKFEVTVSQDLDSGVFERSFTSELEFYDDGYAILKAILIDDPNAFANEVEVKFYDECCGQTNFNLEPSFAGIITAEKIDWCDPICSIKANVLKKNTTYDCIQSTIIWDDQNGFLQEDRVNVRYCTEPRPEAIAYVMFVFYAILNLLLVVPGLISSAIGDNDWWQDMNSRLILCNWYHPAARVTDYVENVCRICGLNLKSSILKSPSSPYKNTLLFAAQVRKGYKPSKTTRRLINQNLPVETLETLMKQHLMPLFNAKYWIVGNDFIFERKDYFDGTNVWIDAEQLYNDKMIVDDVICYSYLGDPRPAFADYSYGIDGVDICSHECKQRFDDIVEWNLPFSPTQKGRDERQFLSSQARYRNDGIERTVYDTMESISFIDGLFANQFSNTSRNVLMSQHTCTNYKFLIWDGADAQYGNIIRQDVPGFSDIRINEDTGNIEPDYPTAGELTNYPFTFREGLGGNLYSQFHIINNPKLNLLEKYRFQFEFSFSCGQLQSFDFSKNVRLFKNNTIVYGEVTELKIDYVKRTMTVTGRV